MLRNTKKSLIISGVLIIISLSVFVLIEVYFNKVSNPEESDVAVVNLGMMVHLEGWMNEVENEQRFREHAAAARSMADLFEQYGAKITFEASPEFVEACGAWDDNVLLELYERGHGAGVHADVGGRADEIGLTQNKMTFQLTKMKKDIDDLLGFAARHVSGICSSLDWAQAAIDAGYEFTTGGVAYCVQSLPEDERPEEFRICANPGVCHDTFPQNLEDRLHPWKISTARNWLTDDPSGKLVFMPAENVLYGLGEEYGYEEDIGSAEFTEEDINAFIDLLDQAVGLASVDEINTMYASWSIGSVARAESPYLEQWLKAVEPYVEAGRVEWKTIPEMYDLYNQSL